MAQIASDAVEFDGHDEQVSARVVAAVAAETGVDPMELPPLYSVLDPDALDSLVRPSAGSPPASLELRFTMAGCEVVVYGDGEVAVTSATKGSGRPTAAASADD